jgi:hypothetical protein
MKDLHKPRFRREYGLQTKLVSHKFFKLYRKKHPKSSIDNYVKMRAVLKAVHETFGDVIATERNGLDLMNIAYLLTVSYKPYEDRLMEKKVCINHKLSSEHKTAVIYSNLDTDGKVCKIFFSMDLPKYKFKYKKSWSFTACRTLKKKVSVNFKKRFNTFLFWEKGKPYKEIFHSIMQ